GGCCQSYQGLYGFLFREARGTGQKPRMGPGRERHKGNRVR
uniref:Uncharacterized protein n=1 Tax=Solanum lycopersicum TaxID=4081 RepID=A0A3Q7IXA4_SOLLC